MKSSLLMVGAISAHIVRTFPDLILFQLIESLILGFEFNCFADFLIGFRGFPLIIMFGIQLQSLTIVINYELNLLFLK